MVHLAFYGDDFTGSIDALWQGQRAGLTGVLVTSLDELDGVDVDGTDVVGVAGIARSLPVAELTGEVGRAITRLAALDPRVLQYKACSTADSSPVIGSLGRAIEIGRDVAGTAPVPVLLAQPDFGRYTVFSHHFARDADTDGAVEVFRLDRQPTMSSHPVTPVTESDLRLLLGAQTELSIGAVPWTSYIDPAAAARLINDDRFAIVVADALSDDHLHAAAAALLADSRRPRFALGSGGLTWGLASVWADREDVAPLPTEAEPAASPTVILNGSGSARTQDQTARAVAAGFRLIDLGADDAADQAGQAVAEGADVVVTASAPVEQIEERLAAVALRALTEAPALRLVLCGGDTSGRVLRRLGVRSLRIESAPWANVVLCRADRRDGDPVELVVKGGQMGHPDLFDDIRSGHPLAPATPTPITDPEGTRC